jgi:hypothetical protein
LNRDEALKSMQEGYKVTHEYFSDDEYLYITDEKMYSEEGYRFEEGWEMRKGGYWEEGWRIFR